MKRTLAAAAIAAMTFTVPAQAETIDLATVKCSELATMDQSGATFMFTWLLGYQNGVNGTTTMDLGRDGLHRHPDRRILRPEPRRRPSGRQHGSDGRIGLSPSRNDEGPFPEERPFRLNWMARETGLEPATFGVTGRRSNQLSYSRNPVRRVIEEAPTPCQAARQENPPGNPRAPGPAFPASPADNRIRRSDRRTAGRCCCSPGSACRRRSRCRC